MAKVLGETGRYVAEQATKKIQRVEDHFVEITEMIEIGNAA